MNREWAERLVGMADDAWAHACAMAWQVGLLILVLWLLDRVLASRVRATVRHALWLLVPAKLLLSPEISLPGSPASWWWGKAAARQVEPARLQAMAQASGVPVTDSDLYALFVGSRPSGEIAAGWDSLPISVGLGAVWLLGAAGLSVLVGWRWRQTRILLNRSRQDPTGMQGLLEEAKATLGVRRPVALAWVAGLPSPAVFGLFRPTLLLPEALASSLSRSQLREIVLHEVAHVKRHDLWISHLLVLLQVLYWWHPLVWLGFSRMRHLAEEATDEMVVVALGDGADSYASTLVEVARSALRGNPAMGPGLLGIVEPRSTLAVRVRRLVQEPLPTSARVGWRGVVLWLALALALLPLARPTARARVEERTDPRPAELASNGNPLATGKTGALGSAASAGSAATPKREPGRVRDGERGTRKPRGSQAIRERLESIRLPHVGFDNVPLGEVVKWLKEEVRQRDPNGRGVNFFINPILDAPPAPALDPATGQPAAVPAPVVQDLSQVPIRIVPALHDVTALAAVEAVTSSSTVAMSAALEDYAVVFLSGAPRPQLATRTYRLAVPAFEQRLRETTAGTTTSTNLQDLVRDWLSRLGVDLNPPGAAFFNDRLGLLMIRAAADQFDAVDQAVEMMNAVPPMIQLETVVVELSEARCRSLRLDRAVHRPNDGSTKGAVAFPPSRLREVLVACTQDPGCRVMELPRMTTLSHREAMIQADRSPASAAGPRTLGTSVYVVPRLGPDEQRIELSVDAVVREFVLDPTRAEAGPTQPAAEHAMASQLTLFEGETLALVTPPVAADTTVKGSPARRFALFVTAFQIDPAGNRFHPPSNPE